MLDTQKYHLEWAKKCLEKYDDRYEAVCYIIGCEKDRIEEHGNKLLELLGLPNFDLSKDDVLLDIGCGCGSLLEVGITDKCKKYIGLDIVPECIEYIKEKFPDLPNGSYVDVVKDYNLPMEDESVDKVCLFSVFTHLMHHEMYRYLLEINRVLKPGGLCIFTFREWFDEDEWPKFLNMVKMDSDETKKPMVDIFIAFTGIRYLTKKASFMSSYYSPEDIYSIAGIHQALMVIRKN